MNLKPSGEEKGSRLPINIALLYLIFAGSWITLSDYFLSLFAANGDVFIKLSAVKGWVFVIVTATLLFAVLQRYVTARMKVEDQRNRADEQIIFQAHLLNVIEQAVIATDVNGSIKYWNRAAEILYGWPTPEAISKNITMLVPVGPSKEQAAEVMEKVKAGNSWSGEFEVQRRDGTSFPAAVTDSPIYDESGNLVGIIGVSSDITEQKRTEKAERLSSERFQLIARATNDAVKDWDIRNNRLWWNETLTRRYGYEENAIATLEAWESRIHPDDREKVKASFQAAFTSKMPTWSHEYRFLHVDGSYGYVLDREYLVCDENGNPTRMLGSMLDITTLKLAELDQGYLAEERDRILKQLQLQFERMPIGYILFDEQFRIREWNPASEKIFGYSKQDVLGRQPYGLIIPEPLKEVIENLVAQLKTSDATVNGINENITKDGRRILCDWFDTPLRNEYGEYTGTMAMVQDITERKKYEEELSGALGYANTVIEKSPVGITTYKASGELITVNEAQAKIVGVPLEQLRKQKFQQLESWKKFGLLDSALAALETGREHAIETHTASPTRKDVWLSCRFVPFQYAHESRLLVLMNDVTERRQAEEVLKESEERLRKLSGYLQKVQEEERKRIALEVHDELGQQLTVLKIEAALVQKAALRFDKMIETGPLLERARALSSTIDMAIATVRRIATDLRPGVLDKLGLMDALQWQVQEFKKRTDIDCVLTTDITDTQFPEEIAITLFRIFQESLTNIARHSGATHVALSVKLADGNIELQIEDNGRGITQEQLQTHASLGLLGISERARMLGGMASVIGNEGKGTTVFVRLPFQQQPITLAGKI